MRRIELLQMNLSKFLRFYSLLRAGYPILPTLHHHTSRVLKVLLKLELGFALIEHLSNRFNQAFGIIHAPFLVETMLSPLEHKFGQCSKDIISHPLIFMTFSLMLSRLSFFWVVESLLNSKLLQCLTSTNQLLLHTL